MLKTQQLFKDLGHEKAIAFLKEEPRMIQVKEYDHFVVLNYNQIFSQEDDPYVMECRSLQLDYQGEVVSRAYPRFFNYGQRPEITGKFVFEGCEVYEKADGSLIRIYWNKFANGGFGRWEIATRGTAYAESESPFYKSFRQAVIEDGFKFKDEAEFHGEYVDFDKILSYPKPVQKPHPPIYMGGFGPRTFDRVIEYCDGWVPIAIPPADMGRLVVELRDAAGHAGRDPDEIAVTYMSLPGATPKDIETLTEAGVERIVFSTPVGGADVVLPALDSYAELAGI